MLGDSGYARYGLLMMMGGMMHGYVRDDKVWQAEVHNMPHEIRTMITIIFHSNDKGMRVQVSMGL